MGGFYAWRWGSGSFVEDLSGDLRGALELGASLTGAVTEDVVSGVGLCEGVGGCDGDGVD